MDHQSLLGSCHQLFEHCEPLVEEVVVVGLDGRRTGTDALVVGTCGGENNAAHTATEQVAQQLAALHILVADGEEEAVAHGLVDILVVDNVEAVAGENLTDALGAVGILSDLIAVVVEALGGLVHHTGQFLDTE